MHPLPCHIYHAVIDIRHLSCCHLNNVKSEILLFVPCNTINSLRSSQDLFSSAWWQYFRCSFILFPFTHSVKIRFFSHVNLLIDDCYSPRSGLRLGKCLQSAVYKVAAYSSIYATLLDLLLKVIVLVLASQLFNPHLSLITVWGPSLLFLLFCHLLWPQVCHFSLSFSIPCYHPIRYENIWPLSQQGKLFTRFCVRSY